MSSRPTRRAATRRTAIVESSSDDEDAANVTRRPADDEEEEDFTPAPPASARKKPSQSTRRRTLNATAASAAAEGAGSSAPAPSPAPTPAPRKRGRPKKSSIAPTALAAQPEPSGANDDPDQSVMASSEVDQSILAQPNKSTAGRKRKSVAPSVRSRSSASVLPTPSPEPPSQQQQQQQQQQRQQEQYQEEEKKEEKEEEKKEEKEEDQPQEEQHTAASPLADITVQSVNVQQPEASQKGRPSPDETVLAAIKPIRAMDTVLEKPMDIVIKSRNMMAMPQQVAEDTAPKARLVITYLILFNFKSYAGKQEVGPFHASFSSVVGPNGSGKSNVIDSLLFVFGFRASKMRQGKISALIHNSAEYPNLDYCEVAVHFQEVVDLPGGGHEVIPNSKLVISRKAFKNNSSQYYINDKSSNFTTVTTLLRDRGVDLDHKRFLILQGEVESIAQMKPKAGNEHEDGLLEYLEDIIGTSKFKTPIEESAGEVEALNDVCLEKSGRVQHVERERKGLEDKKEKALAYVRDENELASKQAALYQLYIAECEDNVAVTDEAVGQMKAQLEAEVEKHEGGEQTIKTLEKVHARGSKEFEAHEKETQALVKEMAKFEQERVKFDEKRKFLADKRKKLEKAIATAEKSSAEASNTIEQCSGEIEQRGHDTAELESRVKEEEAELTLIRESLKGKTQGLSDQIAVKQKSLEPWKEKISQKQAGIAVAESELAILKEKANAGAVALEEVEAKIASIEEGRAAKAEEMQACQAEKAQLEKEAKKVGTELESLAQEEPKRRAQLSNARQKADEARSSLSATQTQGNVLSALMRLRESGRIEGFHGRLGNLGAIDAKYDVAISTACGALDNFVTDTVEAGQQCIEYLRRTNLGRANFMCLDKLRVREGAMAAMETPERAPRLFDLVTAKEDCFRPAFYHALQDTLVAQDLAQANRIAYGARRWRVVTLDGELIDKSGTMSGGGTSKKRGLMSSKLVADTTKEAVAKMEADRDSLEQAFQEFQERQRELESRLRQLRDQIPACGTRLQKMQLEAESAERNLADAQRRAKELAREHAGSGNNSTKSDDSRAAALEREMEKLQREVDKLHSETASGEEEIKALQDRIMEIGGEKLRAQRVMVDTLKQEVISQADEMSAAEVRKAKAEKQKAKLERDDAKATRELETANAECEALEEEVQNQGDKAESFRSRVEEAKEAARVKKEELARVKEELDEKTAELNATRAVEIEMRNKLEENQKVLVENRRRLKHWEEKLSKLVLQDIEDLERGAEPRSGADQEATQDGEEEGEAAEDEEDAEGKGEDNASDDDDDDDDDEEDEDESDKNISASDDGDRDEELEADGEATTAKTKKSKKPKKAAGAQRRARQGPLQLPHYTRDELADMDKETLKGEIAALEEKTQKTSVDLGVLAEYRRRVEEHAARSSDLASAVGQRDVAKRRCDDLRRRRLEGFMEGFGTISMRLKEMYQMITMGGNAELELVDSLDPFSEGILFSVMPPKKSWKNISNLSGGEKTLSSLALVFALHHYKPTPLYVMDEIDAALDFRNVSIVANYIKERTKNAQFIVISLRNNMFELAARLVGVYKVNHMTKSVTIENRDYVINRTTGQPRQPHPHPHQNQHQQNGPPTTNMMMGATMTLR